MVWCGSKNKCHKNTCFKEIELCLQICTVDIACNGEQQHGQIRNQQSITEPQKVQFSIQFLLMLHQKYVHAATQVSLLQVHKFLISRIWKTWERNQITPTYISRLVVLSWHFDVIQIVLRDAHIECNTGKCQDCQSISYCLPYSRRIWCMELYICVPRCKSHTI